MENKATFMSSKVLAQALEHLVVSSEPKNALKMVHNNRKSIRLPINGVKTPRKGPISVNYLRQNKIHLFHYMENNRRTIIAYQYEKGTGHQSNKRFVKYGATIHRDEMTNGKHEMYDKSGHTWTAISRLMNQPVKCELSFDNILQFKYDLRRFLFKRGCYDKTATKKTFQVVIDDKTNLLLASSENTSNGTLMNSNESTNV